MSLLDVAKVDTTLFRQRVGNYTSLGKIPHRSLFAFEHCASVNVYREELTLGITENPHVLALR